MAEEASNSGTTPLSAHEIDQKVMENLLRRMKKIDADNTPTNSESKTEESQ